MNTNKKTVQILTVYQCFGSAFDWSLDPGGVKSAKIKGKKQIQKTDNSSRKDNLV
jgi:hypothetical protein